MSTTKPSHPLHMGNILSDYARRNRISNIRLTHQLSLTPSGVHYRLHTPDISVQTLWQMCRQLQHNFFLDVAAVLPPFDDDRLSEKEKALQQRIDELQQTINAQNVEINVYKNIIKKTVIE
jgi:hypothetical protein